MPDDSYDTMRRHIIQVSGAYLVLAIIASVVSWMGPSFSNSVAAAIGVNVEGLVSVATLTVASLALGYVLFFINIHNLIDRLIFRTRRAVNAFIANYLRKEVVGIVGTQVHPSDRQLMQLFYSFVNRDDKGWSVLRAYAFSVWEPYHIAMNFFGIAILGLIVTLGSVLHRGSDPYSIVPAAFFGVTIVVSLLVARIQLLPKLMGIAEDQLVKMSKEEKSDFDRVVRARLGNVAQ